MRIYISATLRNFFGKNAQVSVPENTVRKALANLISTYPEGEKVLFDENNKLRSFIKIYLNGKNLNVDTLWKTIPKFCSCPRLLAAHPSKNCKANTSKA